MDTKTRIGIQIRELRKAKGLTQDDLAALVDRSTEAISNLERGISLVGIDTLERLSAKLGVPIRDFFEHAGQPHLSSRRAELLARLQATATGLTDKQLALAVNQVTAIRDSG
jgi:transcriptional regulator with XRE-family HTH domain